MGPTSSTVNYDTNNYDYQNHIIDSETVRRNIMNVFQNKQVSNKLTSEDTLNFNMNDNLNIFGGSISRNRYDDHNPDVLINQLMSQINNNNQSGGINNLPLGFESDSYYTISEDLLGTLRKHIYNETNIKKNNNSNQLGGGCGCDSMLPSATSSEPVDFNVIRGGANNNNKKKKNDEDEDEDNDNNDKKKRSQKRYKQVDETTSESDNKIDKIVAPFYSSTESDYYNAKKSGRFD